MLLGLGLALPNVYNDTIHLDERWISAGLLSLLFAFPAPRSKVLGYVAPLVALAFLAMTTSAWRSYESESNSGLTEALIAVPDSQRVFGLAFDKTSRVIRGRPHLQTFAYAQVFHGGTLNFSFAEMAPMPVVFKKPVTIPWRRNAVWVPTLFKPARADQFDYLLVQGDEEIQHKVAAYSFTESVTHAGRWRLYRIVVSPKKSGDPAPSPETPKAP